VHDHLSNSTARATQTQPPATRLQMTGVQITLCALSVIRTLPVSAAADGASSLVLRQRQQILGWIGDPSEESEVGVVDPVLGCEPGVVVLLDLHAAGAEIS
jgi:hypothetical protein